MAFRPARASRVAPPKPPILEKPAPNQPEFPRSYCRLEVGVKPRTISVEVCRDDRTAIELFRCGVEGWTAELHLALEKVASAWRQFDPHKSVTIPRFPLAQTPLQTFRSHGRSAPHLAQTLE